MSAPVLPAAPRTGVWPMYRAMVGVGAACGLLIVTAFQGTKPIIDRNKAEALQRAIFHVVPGTRSVATFRGAGDGRFEVGDAVAPGDPVVHAGYDEQGGLAGFALEAAGMGYQDVIHVLWGYSADRQQIVGFEVLESKETPGLGDRIAFDEDFLANFAALDVSLDEGGTELAHPIVAVKTGTKEQPWQVDGITGATISSKAIASILDASASYWAPRLRTRTADFERREVP